MLLAQQWENGVFWEWDNVGLYLVHVYLGYLENPLDPLDFLIPRPSTHDPRLDFKKKCLFI